MGKISKYSNLYNKEGELIKRVVNGVLKSYTAADLETPVKNNTSTKEEIQNALEQVKETLENGETSNTGTEEEVPGTPERSTEEPRGVQECDTDNEPGVAA